MREPRSAFARGLRREYRAALPKAADRILGGFIRANGSVGFVPFRRDGVPDHSTAVSLGAIPSDNTGGFSVLINAVGLADGVLFRSALNPEELEFELPEVLKHTTISAIPNKSPGCRVLR